ncbi:hypothetical protein SAMN05428988_6139 [Chitinophaga sp. YR573]|uniref:hypothetical protein n=1 Tax=Chitinophaga sp. YR573 TaxID=1881040 RepID=UPI0008B86858|nr:hypothetical protein [Chitinophaga sp. YR573]SEW45809.1 hypothetical protein SAMN05428988_6139 [Chitinophaga sp. YR573]
MESLIALFTGKLGLDQNHFETFYARLKTKSLKKKESLIREGAVCNFIAFVSSGTFRSYIRNNEDEFNNDFYFDIASYLGIKPESLSRIKLLTYINK